MKHPEKYGVSKVVIENKIERKLNPGIKRISGLKNL